MLSRQNAVAGPQPFGRGEVDVVEMVALRPLVAHHVVRNGLDNVALADKLAEPAQQLRELAQEGRD